MAFRLKMRAAGVNVLAKSRPAYPDPPHKSLRPGARKRGPGGGGALLEREGRDHLAADCVAELMAPRVVAGRPRDDHQGQRCSSRGWQARAAGALSHAENLGPLGRIEDASRNLSAIADFIAEAPRLMERIAGRLDELAEREIPDEVNQVRASIMHLMIGVGLAILVYFAFRWL